MVFLKHTKLYKACLSKLSKGIFGIILSILVVTPTIFSCPFVSAKDSNHYCADGEKLIDCFPDKAFAKFVYKNVLSKSENDNEFENYSLTSKDIKSIKHKKDINLCNNKEISDLSGIENFSSLLNLSCSNTKIENLDVSELTDLICLDVSKCTHLENLLCGGNKTCNHATKNKQNSDLTIHYCSIDDNNRPIDHKLTSLNVSGCTNLKSLDCSRTSLTFLDLSGCQSLTFLSCSYSKLTELNLSNIKNLNILSCYANPKLTSINISNCNDLTFIDADQNPELTTFNVSNCANLTAIYCCESPKLAQINTSNCDNLETLCTDECITLRFLKCVN